MQKATLIVSFDCEGKWGMIDHLGDDRLKCISNDNLMKTYINLLSLLDTYNINGTFAFTAAFTLSREEYESCKDLFFKVVVHGKEWLQPFEEDLQCGCYDGWLAPDVFAMVQKEEQHELASHGFIHLPLDENLINLKDAESEFAGISKVASLKKFIPKTFIFPRNKIGFLNLLRDNNFVGYRENIWSGKKVYPFSNILSEFNVLQNSQPLLSMAKNGVVRIPAGYFLNWRSHVRRYIPQFVTSSRWSHILQYALVNRGIVHLWLHPHNLITGYNQWDILEAVLKKFSPYIKSGDLQSLTQYQYCQEWQTQNK